jgi:hypothetical protein
MVMVDEVKTIVRLLMQRPITEAIAIQVEETEGFEHLEIENGVWVGFDEAEYMGGEEHGWIEALIIHILTEWVLETGKGRIYPGDSDFVLDGTPEDIRLKRRPDVVYVSSNNVKHRKGTSTPHLILRWRSFLPLSALEKSERNFVNIFNTA